MANQTQEARIVLALEAMQSPRNLSHGSAATIYKVPYSTLSDRIAGRNSRPEARSNCHRLNDLEEDTIVR